MYYTIPQSSVHFVVYDTVDGNLKEAFTGMRARAEAAEADAAEWRLLYQNALACELRQQARAEAAEARINTLKEQLEICNRALRNTQDSCIAAGDRAYAAEAEVQRLRTALATAKAEGANEERSLHWMQADAEVQRLRALWQRAIDADLLDDPHELEAAIVEASKLLNYPRTLPEDD
jgi:chromosome condensin MukBEF ATPase and DNA-binding subunit MukB